MGDEFINLNGPDWVAVGRAVLEELSQTLTELGIHTFDERGFLEWLQSDVQRIRQYERASDDRLMLVHQFALVLAEQKRRQGFVQ